MRCFKLKIESRIQSTIGLTSDITLSDFDVFELRIVKTAKLSQ